MPELEESPMPRCLARWLPGLAVALAAWRAQAAEPFDYFRNSWNVIGLKDYRNGARITPANFSVADSSLCAISSIRSAIGVMIRLATNANSSSLFWK